MAPLILSTPEIIGPVRAILGESPVWSAACRALYWVDIKALKLHRFLPQTRDQESWQADEPIGCINAPDAEGFLLAATRSGFARLYPDTNGTVERTPLASPEAETLPGNRFNDGKRAPDGSFWAGTMDDAEKTDSGAWWRLDPATKETIPLDTGYRVTNGPAFDAKRKRVYLTDSARQTVFMADWINGGGFENKRVFLQFAADDGFPDGMQVHTDGSLWIAFWDGACLRRFSPDGKLIQQVNLPVRRPTSLAFAPEVDSIFVTSASIGVEGEAEGALLQIRTA